MSIERNLCSCPLTCELARSYIPRQFTDKKEKKIFLIYVYEEIQMGSGANEENEENRKYLVIYNEEAVSHIWLCTHTHPIPSEFLFLSVNTVKMASSYSLFLSLSSYCLAGLRLTGEWWVEANSNKGPRDWVQFNTTPTVPTTVKRPKFGNRP